MQWAIVSGCRHQDQGASLGALRQGLQTASCADMGGGWGGRRGPADAEGGSRGVTHWKVTKAVGPGRLLHVSCSSRMRRRNSVSRFTYQSIRSALAPFTPG